MHRSFVFVEKFDHQSGAAAEAAEQGAFAHPGGGRDVIGGDLFGIALGDQGAGRVQQEPAVAGGVAAFRVAPSIGKSARSTVSTWPL